MCRYREEAIRRGVAYASCGHAFHPICLLEYEKHAAQRAGDQPIKCPLCRQPYTVRHFIPDDNLRSLCLEHTLHDAIVLAEAAAKEADEKAKEAGDARAAAAQAANHAVRLRQQAGPAFCSAAMTSRLHALTAGPRAGAPTLMAPTGAAAVAASSRPSAPLLPRAPSRSETRTASSTFTTRPTGQLPAARHVQNSPAAVAAAVVAPAPPQPADPGPGFDLGVHVPLHEQIATMRISADATSLQMAAQHPEVVLGIEEPE